MLSEELTSLHAALGCLLPRVDVEDADLLRIVRRNMLAAAELADQLERAPMLEDASALVDRPALARELACGGQS